MFKTLKVILYYFVTCVFLYFLWIPYCFLSTSSEAGQATGLAIGFFYIPLGLFPIFIGTPLFLYLKKNWKRGLTFKNIICLGILFLMSMCVFLVIRYFYFIDPS